MVRRNSKRYPYTRRALLLTVTVVLLLLSIFLVAHHLMNTYRGRESLEVQPQNINSVILENASDLLILHTSVFCENYEDGYIYGNCILVSDIKNNSTKSITVYGITLPQLQVNLATNVDINIGETRRISTSFTIMQKTPIQYLFDCYLVTSTGRIKLEPRIAV